MSDCFASVLKYLEPILNKDLLGLRAVALKTFSTLINHCRHTTNVDEEIKKTRKGLQNIAMDYIGGLVTLYTKDESENTDVPMGEVEGEKKNKRIQPGQVKILNTLQDFASIAKTGKLSNLFLASFAQVVQQKEGLKGYQDHAELDKMLKNLDVLIAMLE